MPKIPKSWRREPTKEEIFRQRWETTNLIIKKAMLDRGVKYDKDLAAALKMDTTILSRRLTMKTPWTFQELTEAVDFLKIPAPDAARMLGIRV